MVCGNTMVIHVYYFNSIVGVRGSCNLSGKIHHALTRVPCFVALQDILDEAETRRKEVGNSRKNPSLVLDGSPMIGYISQGGYKAG